MGRSLVIMVMGVLLLFSVIALKYNEQRLDIVDANASHFRYAQARNCATSGAYLALSKVSFDTSWTAGFQNLSLLNGTCDVVLENSSSNAALSSMERIITSTGTYEGENKTVDVHIGIPPDLSTLAAYATGDIVNVGIWDEIGNIDNSLAIENAPFMVPYDFEALEALAEAQGQVINGDFSPSNNYPNGSFYYSGTTPNVTKVTGDFTVLGGRTLYGIYVVYGDAYLQGSARLEGVLTLPDPGSVVLHGGGDPKEANITGGVFVNGGVDGTGNHITIKYDSSYMQSFAQFQIPLKVFIVSWLESPSI